jgi:hypothetical protein
VHTACVLALAVGRSIPGNGWDGPQRVIAMRYGKA